MPTFEGSLANACKDCCSRYILDVLQSTDNPLELVAEKHGKTPTEKKLLRRLGHSLKEILDSDNSVLIEVGENYRAFYFGGKDKKPNDGMTLRGRIYKFYVSLYSLGMCVLLLYISTFQLMNYDFLWGLFSCFFSFPICGIVFDNFVEMLEIGVIDSLKISKWFDLKKPKIEHLVWHTFNEYSLSQQKQQSNSETSNKR